MGYLKLHPDVYLVTGSGGSVVHDTSRKKAFALDYEHSLVLEALEGGSSIGDASAVAGVSARRVEEIALEIEEAGLGSSFENDVYVEKINTSPKWLDKLAFRSPPRIDKLFVQFGGECGLNCDYCSGARSALSVSCWCCTPTPEGSIDELANAVKDAAQLEPNEVILMCPPSTDCSAIRKLVDAATESVSKVVVASDSSLPIVSLSCSSGKFRLVLKLDVTDFSLLELDEWAKGVPMDTVVQLVREDDDCEIEPYVQLLLSHGLQATVVEVVTPKRGSVDNRIMSTPCDTTEFNQRTSHHACLSSIITIREDGAVFQCPRLPSLRLANRFDLVGALRSDRYDKMAGLSMNDIAPCRACEMRYLCSDCRFLEIAAGSAVDECVRCVRTP